MPGQDDIVTLGSLVEQGRFGDARAIVTERGAALFAARTRKEVVALTAMLAVVDQAVALLVQRSTEFAARRCRHRA